MIISLIEFFIISYEYSFEEIRYFSYVRIIFQVLFSMDIIIKFNTAYYDQGVIINEVGKRYFYSLFIFDFATLLPYILKWIIDPGLFIFLFYLR